MKLRLLTALCLIPLFASAEDITLENCLGLARDNYPAIRRYDLIKQSARYDVSNASKAFVPQLSLSAGAFAFTDVTDIPDNMQAAVGEMRNQAAMLSVTLKQNIYDGGATATSRRIIASDEKVSSERLSVSMYDVNQRVQNLFFGVLVAEEMIRQNQLLSENLQIGMRSVSDEMQAGMANESDMNAVRVELVKCSQQRASLETTRDSYRRMMSLFIGRQISSADVFVRPAVVTAGGGDVLRPELSYLKAREQQLKARHDMLNVRLMPKLSAFATGMVHTNVSDLLNNRMLFAGLSLSWNIGALYTRKNDLQKLRLQQQDIDSERAVFMFNNRLQNEDSDGRITGMRKMIELDDEMVTLRESILEKGRLKVAMGTESVDEMLRQINAVSMARQQKALHEIELLKEIYNKRIINNN